MRLRFFFLFFKDETKVLLAIEKVYLIMLKKNCYHMYM